MDIGQVLGAGFALVRRQPGAVAVWAAINIVLTSMSQFGMMSLFGTMMALPQGAAPDFGAMMGSFGLTFVLQFVVLLVQLMIWGAVYRAIFRPDAAGMAFLRLSMDELRLLGLGAVSILVSFGLMLLIFGFLAALGFSSGSSAGDVGSAIGVALLAFLLFIGIFIAFIFLGVRFALAWPMAIADRRIRLGEAWRLSRGQFWRMFAAALVIVIGLSVAAQIVSSLQFGSVFAGLGSLGADPEAMNRALVEQFSTISVIGVIAWVLGGVVNTAWIVMMGAGISEALKQVRPTDYAELADVYA